MNTQSDLRKAIKTQFPNLKFTIKLVSFVDLARDSRLFVTSNDWGMTKGNHDLYQAVNLIAKDYGAIVSW